MTDFNFKNLNINKILMLIAGGILLLIIAISAISLCTKNARPGQGLRHEDPQPKSVAKGKTAFNHIGQIRVFTKEDSDSSRCVILLVPWFEYDGEDQAFYEELDRKHLSLRAILTDYFSRHTKNELISLGEGKIKEELKNQINESLVLGKISRLYFNDYLFLD
ncbi:MAG: hypothetical protein K5873_04730 [Treponema sp.]|nr:hypothetical protein [Treponema sp.]